MALKLPEGVFRSGNSLYEYQGGTTPVKRISDADIKARFQSPGTPYAGLSTQDFINQAGEIQPNQTSLGGVGVNTNDLISQIPNAPASTELANANTDYSNFEAGKGKSQPSAGLQQATQSGTQTVGQGVVDQINTNQPSPKTVQAQPFTNAFGVAGTQTNQPSAYQQAFNQNQGTQITSPIQAQNIAQGIAQ